MPKNDIYDVLVIGGGAAGYSGAVYAARFQLKTIVFAKEKGGLLFTTHLVENYPGIVRASGPEIMQMFENHVKDYNIPIMETEIVDLKKEGDLYVAKDTEGKTYKGHTVIYATGTKRRRLDVPGDKEYYSKGVSYCATCDAPLFRNKVLVIVGGSDSAAKESLLLAEYASKVYIVYRGENVRAEPINLKRVMENKKIEIITNTNVIEIKGEKFVKSVVFDKPYKGKKEMEVGGVFVEIGHLPQTDLAKKLGVKLNQKGEIMIDRMAKTNVPGLFAAGDVGDAPYKQAITGAAEAVIASFSAYEYINELKDKRKSQ